MTPQKRTPASVLLPSLSLTNQCCSPGQAPALSGSTRSLIELANKLEGPAYEVAQVMLSTGARISEVLSLCPLQVSYTGHVYLEARKGSRSRVVFCPLLLPRRSQALALHSDRLFPAYTYERFRTQLLALKPTGWPRSAQRRVLTNAFRRAAAEIALSVSQMHLAAAQDWLGHKRPTSTTFYLPN